MSASLAIANRLSKIKKKKKTTFVYNRIYLCVTVPSKSREAAPPRPGTPSAASANSGERRLRDHRSVPGRLRSSARERVAPAILTCPRSTRCTSRRRSCAGARGTRSTRGGCSPGTRSPGSAAAPAPAGSGRTTALCPPGSGPCCPSSGDAAAASSDSCGPGG